MSIRTINFCILLGAVLIAFVGLLLLVSSALFVAGVSLSWLQVPLAIIIAVGFAWWGVNVYFPANRRRAFGWVIGISLGAVIGFVLLCGLFYDVSWDGQTYHAEAIVALAKGWNPFRTPSPDGAIFPLFMNFFAKGPWILSAALFKFTGNYEQGKAFHLILMLACGLTALGAFSSFRTLSRKQVVTLSLLLAFNPISIYQMLTFYVDGQLSSLLMITVCLLILIYRHPDRFRLVTLALVAILVINVKLSGGLYFAFIVGGYVLWYFIARKKKRVELVLWLAVGCLVGGVFVGYSPYVSQFATNLLKRGDPLYPTNWQSLIVIEYNSPPNFITMGRWEKLFASFFSVSDAPPRDSQFKFPLTVTLKEIEAFGAPDTRIGGFGPLFGAAILMMLALFARLRWAYREQLKYQAVILVLTAFILISALSNSEAWWARYVPQFWLAPVLVAFMGFYIIRRDCWRVLTYTLIVTLCINNAIIFFAYTASTVGSSVIVAQQLASLKATTDSNGPLTEQLNSFIGTRYRFDRYGIRYTEVDQLPCPENERIQAASSQMLMCIKKDIKKE